MHFYELLSIYFRDIYLFVGDCKVYYVNEKSNDLSDYLQVNLNDEITRIKLPTEKSKILRINLKSFGSPSILTESYFIKAPKHFIINMLSNITITCCELFLDFLERFFVSFEFFNKYFNLV